MSLMNMVAKVAVGYALAKGVSAVTKSGGMGKVMEGLQGRSAGTGTPMGTATGGAPAGSGGLGDMLGRLGGGAAAPGGASGGLGGILGQLTGGAAPGGAGGGLGDMLGQLTGQAGGNLSGGGLGGLGGLLGGLAAARGGNEGAAGSLEALLGREAPAEEPPEEQTAGLMIRAMISAARCDGELDGNEQETLLATIGEGASPEDMNFVREAMAAPVNARGIAQDTPKGMETQVYSMSVMAIEPDHPAEAQYLHELAGSLGISEGTVNEIHDSFGVPRLYG